MSISQPLSVMGPRFWLGFTLALVAAELFVLSILYKHAIEFTCLANAPSGFCQFFSGMVVSALTLFGALALFAMLAPQVLRELVSTVGARLWPIWINLAGFGILLIPLFLLRNGLPGSMLVVTAIIWLIGSVIAAAGILLFVASWPTWVAFLKTRAHFLVPLVLAGVLAPKGAALLRPIWQLETVASVTFEAVATAIGWLGYNVEIDAPARIIGANNFYISVANQCSGVEGLALVTIFVTLYLVLFRQDLRFPLALILYPIGLLASFVLNIVRVVVLLAIGLEGNPDLAVGGFHSHAGWLMFTIISVAIIFFANKIPALRKMQIQTATVATPLPPLRQDPVAARILPFAVFMLSALIGSAFVANPGQFYPVRALLVGASLALFWPLYRRLDWAPSLLGIAVGAVIGVMWILIPYPVDGPPPYGEFAGALLVFWFICRGIGTILFVPLLEELFFRDYLVSRLRLGTSALWHGAAIVASAAAFAGLHGRWAEAFIAALAFSFVYHRTGRITDAVIAHAVANAIVFAVALTTGQLHII